MADNPHIAWPFQADANGNLLVVEQDSDIDIGSCIATCLLWPLGSRELRPEFGINEQLFLQDGPDLDELRAAVMENEDRADLTPVLEDETLPGFVATVRAGFNPTVGEPAQ